MGKIVEFAGRTISQLTILWRSQADLSVNLMKIKVQPLRAIRLASGLLKRKRREFNRAKQSGR